MRVERVRPQRLVVWTVVFLGVLPLPAASAEDAVSTGAEKTARAFLKELVDDDIAAAVARFDETMTAALAPQRLRQIWQQLTADAGAYESIGTATIQPVGAHLVVDLPCTFERKVIDLRVSVDAEQRVAGFFKMGERTRHAAAGALRLETKTGTLHGTLDLPEGDGPFPAVVLLAGSGPTDRDGNQPGQLRTDCLKQLGHALAANGIAVLRVDKRGIAASRRAGPDESLLRFGMFVEDAAAWLELLQQDARFAPVGIMGHSQGALVAMLAARRVKAKAVVSLAGPGRKAGDLIREQLSALPAELRAKNDEILKALEAGKTVDDVPPALLALYRPSVQPFLASWIRVDPREAIRRLDVPTLIVQGTTDAQVKESDARALKKAQPKAFLVVLEGMNHVLKAAKDASEQQQTYTDPSLPLFPGLAEKIATFLRQALTPSAAQTPAAD